MGIPKFFRYISERYPLTSQLIQENKIPEFDNLYLDFNGIIHNCSHPNDGDAHFRLSEEQIFTSIFSYVDLLFGKIKPKKLFFMAVDGVAPRAKMNQQRGRRFRTAKEARELREKAEAKGEVLPVEKAFDSNCITPGTPFMARLSEQLRYFVNKKITEDSNWRDVEVVLSGHEVPGEGEHKIMEYIRHARAQPNYNPNVRHCLYGLDADLIMLSLLSHDPHFCLLREEVKFGPSRNSKRGNASLDATNFYLLHLSLMREYLDLEFREIAPVLGFEYNLERIIDDFILLAVFVGNDFLPHLPDLHIHENGLQRLWDVYRKVLPGMDGYINESGVINTKRLQVVLDEMGDWELEVFEKEYADLNWYKGKQAKVVKEMELARARNKLVVTRSQREIFDKVKTFVEESRGKRGTAILSMRNEFPARDRVFILKLAEDLHLGLRWDEFDEEDRSLVTWRFPGHASEEDQPNGGHDKDNDEDEDEGEWEGTDSEDDSEAEAAVERVLKKYEKAPVADDDTDGGFDARHARSVNEKMDEWKRNYYKGKLEISYDDPEEMGDLVYRYVEGLQWVMLYYFSGVASWGWFYNYHYAPRISDLRGIDKMVFKFELGRPFRPFEQLMGVLPVASKDHIPLAYQNLMFHVDSPIRDFYPLEFEQDLNGKKAEWEAVVKIPFIDEKRLLEAMQPREEILTAEEKSRNSFGTSTKFSYSHGEPTLYPSSLEGFFPPINNCTCVMEPFDLPTLDGLHPVMGLVDGVLMGKAALAGFPSLNTLPHTAVLGVHGVNVHGTESKNKSIVVNIQNPHEARKTEDIAKEMIGKRTFTGWPFLREGMVVAVSDSHFKYDKMSLISGGPQRVISNPHTPHGLGYWKMKAERIETTYSKRSGVITGMIDVLLHVRPLKGMKRLESGALVKDYEDADKEQEHAVQMTISEVASEDPRFLERAAPPLSEEFPDGSKIFFLGEHAYGVAAAVSATTETTLSVILAFFPTEKAENDQFKSIVEARKSVRYFPSFRVADMLGISGRALSKITSSFLVITADGQKTNLGLNLKFDAKALKVIDYTRKEQKHWEFSEKAIELIRDYKNRFPAIFYSLDAGGDAIGKASDLLQVPDPDSVIREAKAWLKATGIRDMEAVSLFCDQLGKDTVMEIEKLADSISANKVPSAIKKAIVKGIPRQAVLKPAHAVYRLQTQQFALGDRVTMVQDSGAVPLCVKGVVIGLNAKTMDVVWDVPFMSGTTMGDRCSQYRGSSVEFNTCLNLTNPQFVTSTAPKAGPVPPPAPRSRWTGAGPQTRLGQIATSSRQAPILSRRDDGQATEAYQAPIAIMTNPNRGRGGPLPSRGIVSLNGHGNASLPNAHALPFIPRGEGSALDTHPRGRGGALPTGTPAIPPFRGRGGGGGLIERGGYRGGARGGAGARGGFRGGRGRGRGGQFSPSVPS
ncbi:5'-3' exoribonuclease 1 [Mycena indigotica]|uniref:5'-3' exoribonuclease 1 n=1 Tax=Mycena indigotica TaxID=2126181 RepID=A0A8H6SQC4_9AGAR|nr:5'-3' exoribonuclease 1 [Mycena indigotica]KAF7304085.1 5'-3' exoribonuclease 1 [Mycena indigotica]